VNINLLVQFKSEAVVGFGRRNFPFGNYVQLRIIKYFSRALMNCLRPGLLSTNKLHTTNEVPYTTLVVYAK
jgi:hypothetical protein